MIKSSIFLLTICYIFLLHHLHSVNAEQKHVYLEIGKDSFGVEVEVEKEMIKDESVPKKWSIKSNYSMHWPTTNMNINLVLHMQSVLIDTDDAIFEGAKPEDKIFFRYTTNEKKEQKEKTTTIGELREEYNDLDLILKKVLLAICENQIHVLVDKDEKDVLRAGTNSDILLTYVYKHSTPNIRYLGFYDDQFKGKGNEEVIMFQYEIDGKSYEKKTTVGALRETESGGVLNLTGVKELDPMPETEIVKELDPMPETESECTKFVIPFDDEFTTFVTNLPSNANKYVPDDKERNLEVVKKLGLMYLLKETWNCENTIEGIEPADQAECQKYRDYLKIIYEYLFRVHVKARHSANGAVADNLTDMLVSLFKQTLQKDHDEEHPSNIGNFLYFLSNIFFFYFDPKSNKSYETMANAMDNVYKKLSLIKGSNKEEKKLNEIKTEFDATLKQIREEEQESAIKRGWNNEEEKTKAIRTHFDAMLKKMAGTEKESATNSKWVDALVLLWNAPIDGVKNLVSKLHLS